MRGEREGKRIKEEDLSQRRKGADFYPRATLRDLGVLRVLARTLHSFPSSSTVPLIAVLRADDAVTVAGRELEVHVLEKRALTEAKAEVGNGDYMERIQGK